MAPGFNFLLKETPAWGRGHKRERELLQLVTSQSADFHCVLFFFFVLSHLFVEFTDRVETQITVGKL